MELYKDKKVSSIRHCFNVFLVFLYIFMIRVCGAVDTSIIAGVVSIFLLLFNYQAINYCVRILLSDRLQKIYFLYFCLTFWIICVVGVLGTGDYSFLRPLIHGLLQIMIGIIIYVYFSSKKTEKYTTTYIIISFVIQAIVEWLAMISPMVKAFVYSTKDTKTIRIADQYGGIRGLSLSGSSFFGLALAFGFVYILFFSEKNLLFKKYTVCRYLIFGLLVTGTFFAGRTGLVSLPIIMFYFVVTNRKYKRNFTIRKTTIIGTITFLVACILATIFLGDAFGFSDALLVRLGYLKNFIFEFWISFMNGNGFATSSSTHMFKDMYFKMPFFTLLFGDGWYTVKTGYYMSTDVGVMRPILYMGIPGLIMLFLIQKQILELGDGIEKKIYFVLWIYLIIAQLKGEAIGFSLLVINILTLYSLSPMSHVDNNNGGSSMKDKASSY